MPFLFYYYCTTLCLFFPQIVMQKLSADAVSCLTFIPNWKNSLRTLQQHQSLSHVNPMAVATNWSLKCASTCTLTQVSSSYLDILFRIFGFHVSKKFFKKTPNRFTMYIFYINRKGIGKTYEHREIWLIFPKSFTKFRLGTVHKLRFLTFPACF